MNKGIGPYLQVRLAHVLGLLVNARERAGLECCRVRRQVTLIATQSISIAFLQLG